MQELVKEYRDWRRENDLPWNPNLVPKSFDGMPDLEHKYWQAEQKAQDFETQRDWSKAIEVKALPPARPRKPLISKGDRPGEVFVRKQGTFGGAELEALLGYIDESLSALADQVVKLREKDMADIQKALDERMKWRGTWRSGEKFVLNDLCQDKGTIFVCVAPEAEGRPGTDAGWRQLVKTQERPAK